MQLVSVITLLINQIKKKMRAISVKDLLAVIGWASAIALMTIIAEYTKTPRPGSYGISFDALDLAIVLATSLLFGMFLVDPVKILYAL